MKSEIEHELRARTSRGKLIPEKVVTLGPSEGYYENSFSIIFIIYLSLVLSFFFNFI